jgi:L-ascorbate metabolism protein UlaG (beta-lactamase superfamily)
LRWIFLDFFDIIALMVVNHFGNGCFRLQSGETSILINPDNNRLKADLILRTIISTEPGAVADASEATTIAFPGEYEVKGIEVVGFPITGESTEKFLKTAYAVNWEDMKFVFLGHLSAPIDSTLIEEFADPDVLILPVGGGHFLEPEIAAKIAKQLEARIIIPSFYKNPDEFLKALGKKTETVEKFVFKQKDIVTDKGRPVVLKES